MKKVVIFGGTTEGRCIAEYLAKSKIGVIYLVATEYGRQPITGSDYIDVRIGRLDADGMRALFFEVKPDAIVDATHPFAELVKIEIENALFSYDSVPFFRVVRDEEDIDYSNCSFFDSAKECVEALNNTTGTILLTTGSKELSVFCQDESLRKRIIARVIPSVESINICLENGLKGNQIIAMQGPFSAGMNLAILRETKAAIIVLKEGGKSSGERERIVAANKAGAKCYVIRRPKENIEGLSLTQVKARLNEILEINKDENEIFEEHRISVSLVGYGMGFGSITLEAKEEIEHANYIFGAPRLLVSIDSKAEKFQYYLPKDILPKLKELEESVTAGKKRAVVLFSGDSGFYSGTTALLKALKEQSGYKIKVLPGISSVSALAAKIHESWQDATLLSTHGSQEDEWIPKLISAVKYNEKTFVLTSGSEDVRKIGEILLSLETDGTSKFSIAVGTNLYSDEKIIRLNASKCMNFNEDGLTILFIKNKSVTHRRLVPGLTDKYFLRSDIPMSKEEIRALSICKLGVRENAICYDIGSGSGSVAVELGRLGDSIRVYAIELKNEACQLIQSNIDKFNLRNVHLIEGTAPDVLHSLDTPTHVFIGGSGGRLDEIIHTLIDMNSSMRIVINAVTFETVAEVNNILKKYEIEAADIIQVSISKAKHAGNHNVMQGLNPVYIVSFNLS